MSRLLNSFKHYCFHSGRYNVHTSPDLYRCAKGSTHEALIKNDPAKANPADACSASISLDMAKQAGLVDDKGDPLCPLCNGSTVLVPGVTVGELHASVCTDETKHYPEMRKAGTITEPEYQKWISSLTHDERCGVYKRVPDIHIMARFTGEEDALRTSDPKAFAALVNTRLIERTENALIHQIPHQHKTVSPAVSL